MGPIRFLWAVMGFAFTIGFTDSFVQIVQRMAGAAAHAHQYDQISYSKYTQLLWARQVPAQKNMNRRKPSGHPPEHSDTKAQDRYREIIRQ